MRVRKYSWGCSARSLGIAGGFHFAILATTSSSLLFCGCGTSVSPDEIDGPGSTLGLSTTDLDGLPSVLESASNDELTSAERVQTTSDPIVVRGEIERSTDVDVYDLGAIEPGDRILVDAIVADGMKGAIALFDEQGMSLLVNDHRNVFLGRKGPFIDFTARRAASSVYAAFALTPGFQSTGEYALTAAIQPDSQVPTPNPDIVLLNFVGGSDISIGSRNPINVPAFDAASISSRFEGQTDAIVRRVVQLIRDDFVAFDVDIRSTSEGEEFDGTQSRLFFGTFDAALLGVAEGVDEYNDTARQEAIVFTDTFAAFDVLEPSIEEIAQALANVASHEIGHLLGLVHTNNVAELMDVTASLSELTLDQAFGVAPIYEAVFPLGEQDAVQYLLDAVGGDPEVARAVKNAVAINAKARQTSQKQEAVRKQAAFSVCGLRSH